MHFSQNVKLFLQQMLLCAQLYLVDSTVEEGTGEVEGLLGADGPVAAQVQPVYKHNTFLPTLWSGGKRNDFTARCIFSHKHIYKRCMKRWSFLSLTGSFTNVSLGYPYANSLPMKNPGKLGVSERDFQGARYRLKQTSTSNTVAQHWKCQSVLDSVKHSNLSIKLGFISRLYIVKSRKGILFNKTSPTRHAGTQIRTGLNTAECSSDLTAGITMNSILCVDHLYVGCRGPPPGAPVHSSPPINLRFAVPAEVDDHLCHLQV